MIEEENTEPVNLAMADSFMAIFGFVRFDEEEENGDNKSDNE